jgi:hypothetical protein
MYSGAVLSDSDRDADFHTPFDSLEYEQRVFWRRQTRLRQLVPTAVLACWSDVCGFGTRLQEAGWDLQSAQAHGLLEVLNDVYDAAARPLIIEPDGGATERILILNDGVARTTDVGGEYPLDCALASRYLSDLMILHFQIVPVLARHGLGLRTILAGGQRIQYSPEHVTGATVTSYMGEPSPFAAGLLGEQFLYHPAPFQMNTAFARAYMLDEAGTAAGIAPNYVFLDQSWIDVVNAANADCILVAGDDSGTVSCSRIGAPSLELTYDKCIRLTLCGMMCKVYRLVEFVQTDGNEVVRFPLNPELLVNGDWPRA